MHVPQLKQACPHPLITVSSMTSTTPCSLMSDYQSALIVAQLRPPAKRRLLVPARKSTASHWRSAILRRMRMAFCRLGCAFVGQAPGIDTRFLMRCSCCNGGLFPACRVAVSVCAQKICVQTSERQ